MSLKIVWIVCVWAEDWNAALFWVVNLLLCYFCFSSCLRPFGATYYYYNTNALSAKQPLFDTVTLP